MVKNYAKNGFGLFILFYYREQNRAEVWLAPIKGFGAVAEIGKWRGKRGAKREIMAVKES